MSIRCLVAEALSLTRAQIQVAVWLAEGKTVPEIAETTGAIYGT